MTIDEPFWGDILQTTKLMPDTTSFLAFSFITTK